MSIRLSLYDFFAYMIPGVFYILITAIGLSTFGLVDIDLSQWTDFSLFTFLILLGLGYVLGQLIDEIAYRWLRLRKGRSRNARQKALASFRQRYPWIDIDFLPEEWAILLKALQIQTPHLVPEIEQQNALSIMLRNISLGLVVTAIMFFLIFILVYTHIGNLIIAIIALALSFVAIDRSSLRRHWFYMGIYEAFATNLLLQQKKLESKIDVKQAQPNVVTEGKENT